MITGELTVTLAQPTLVALLNLADADGIDPQGVILRAIEAEIARARAPVRIPVRAQERLLAPLRALLARDLAVAQTWDDLQSRLIAKGYRLREAGGGLALVTHPGGRRLCKASELGFSYSDLMRRFGRPFPGHAHHKLAARVLDPMRRANRPLPPQGDDFTLIERF